MIKVYIDYGSGTDIIAIFDDEETYMICLPSLKKIAKDKYNATIVETVTDEVLTDTSN